MWACFFCFFQAEGLSLFSLSLSSISRSLALSLSLSSLSRSLSLFCSLSLSLSLGVFRAVAPSRLFFSFRVPDSGFRD